MQAYNDAVATLPPALVSELNKKLRDVLGAGVGGGEVEFPSSTQTEPQEVRPWIPFKTATDELNVIIYKSLLSKSLRNNTTEQRRYIYQRKRKQN